MDNNFEYRKYKPGDETGIVALLKKTFPKWSRRSVEYWKWKYIYSPLGVFVYVALDGDKIISVLCDIPLHLKLGDQIINGFYGDDTATDPDYRGKGVYTKLYKFETEDRIDNGFYFNFWETENPIVVKASSHYFTMLFPFSLCNMIKIKDVNKYLESSDRDTLTNKLGFTLLKSANSLANLTSFNSKIKQDYSIINVPSFDDRINVFWDRVKVDYSFILEKRKDYLNWRYCADNSEEYHVRLATMGDEVIGYCALRYLKNDIGLEGTILDVLALTERFDVADALIEDALAQFDLLGANSVYCQTIRGHPYEKLLAKRGFIDVSRASKSLIYYTNDDYDFDHKKFSEFNPKSIYFNFY